MGLRLNFGRYGIQLSLAPTAVREGTSIDETIQGIDRFGLLAGLLAAQDRAGRLATEGARERFQASLEKLAEPLSFGNVLLLTAALFVLFHRRRPLFVAHGVFSMHLVSFVLLSSLIFVPGLRMSRGRIAPVLVLIAVVSLLQVFYLIAAILRFYYRDDRRRVWPKAIAVGSALLLYLLNSAFITLAQTAAAAIALARL